MGYVCDQCTTAPASVYCLVDQRVLCKGCDERLHTASRLSRKHDRLALQNTSDRPTCDVCQDSKAVVFCTEDRALMCRGCDVMVHGNNVANHKHTRHLLTGWMVGHVSLPPPGEAASSADTLTVGPAIPAKPPVTSAHVAESGMACAQAAGKPPAGRSGARGGYRANGTADYEDYGALRTLLGYPTPNPPPSSARKSQPKQQKQQQQYAQAGAGPPPGAAGPMMTSHLHGGMMTGAAGPLGSPAVPSGAAGPAGGAGPVPITLTASELLGMPLGDELSAKDIDAVFMPDAYTAFDDFDVDFSSLFAVPDFGPPSSDESGGHHRGGGSSDPFADLQQQQELGMPPLLDDEDGLVPDIFGGQQASKRRRL